MSGTFFDPMLQATTVVLESKRDYIGERTLLALMRPNETLPGSRAGGRKALPIPGSGSGSLLEEFAQARAVGTRHLSGGRHAVRLHVFANEFDDVVHRSAGLEDAGYADFLEALNILIGNNAADQNEHIVHLVLLEQVHDARDDGIVCPGKDRQTDDLHIFLQRGAHNHFGRLPEARVNDFHAGVAQGSGNHFGAAIVAVEAGFGNQNANLRLSGHREHLTTERTGSTVRIC